MARYEVRKEVGERVTLFHVLEEADPLDTKKSWVVVATFTDADNAYGYKNALEAQEEVERYASLR